MNKDKIASIIYETMDYDKFKFIKSNRGINGNNVENLKESMNKKALPIPVIVNEKYEMIDGQHSFTARRELGLPILYQIVEGAGEEEMITLNVNKASWKPADYLNYFCDNNFPEYIKFQKIRSEYGVQISDLLTIIDELSDNPIGENAMGRKFKEGSLDMSEEQKLLNFLHDLQLFEESENYLSTYFIRAFLRLYVSDFYSSEFIEYRVSLCGDKIKNNEKGYTDKQCRFLADIYSSPRKEVLVAYNENIKSFFKIGKSKKRNIS